MPDTTIIVTNHPQSIRLDRFLREYFSGITQGIIEQALRKNQITVDGLKASANLRITNDNVITISKKFKFVPTDQLVKTHSLAAKQLATDLLTKYKIFADEHILVINKPAGLAVQGGSKIKLSVNDALECLNAQNADVNNNDYKITHRLDKDTSGLLLIARGRTAANIIASAFKEQIIKKTYLAVLSKIPINSNGIISNYIGKLNSKHYQQVMEDNVSGKLAITNYRVLKTVGQQALVEFMPLTGRMHQLRFHSQFIGCPIVGDLKYGFTADTAACNYLLLHAYQLTIPVNLFGKAHDFTITPPIYWPVML